MSKPKIQIAKKHSNVIALQHTHPEHALEGLNRITGLNFARWPESLVPSAQAAPCEETEANNDTQFAAERVICN